MDPEILEKYKKAGRIAAEVRDAAAELARPGAKLSEMAEKIESLIREKGAEVAFPVNLSVNDEAAHYTPGMREDKTLDDDLLKIDVGVHVDGYVGDTAVTVDLSGKHTDLVNASKSALEAALKLVKPGARLSDISAAIERAIKKAGFQPISNLTGHGLDRYDLHTEPTIPNVATDTDYELKENQVIAIEPFATTGAGRVKDSENVLIFSLSAGAAVRNQEARRIIKFAWERNGLPFAERWLPIDGLVKTRFALRELRQRGVLVDYAVLKEAKAGMVSQAEHTVVVQDPPIITTELPKKKSDQI